MQQSCCSRSQQCIANSCPCSLLQSLTCMAHAAQFFNSAEISFGYASVASSTALSNVS